MLINERPHQVFSFKHINSLVSFEEWLKENLSIYPEAKSIPNAHIKSLLEYLKEVVYEQRVEEKRKWIEQIDALLERLEE